MESEDIQYVCLESFPLIISRAEGVPGYGDLKRGSVIISERLSQLLHGLAPETSSLSRVVALLCPSSVDFLFTWLGLMRKGFSVLLIAYVTSITV